MIGLPCLIASADRQTTALDSHSRQQGQRPSSAAHFAVLDLDVGRTVRRVAPHGHRPGLRGCARRRQPAPPHPRRPLDGREPTAPVGVAPARCADCLLGGPRSEVRLPAERRRDGAAIFSLLLSGQFDDRVSEVRWEIIGNPLAGEPWFGEVTIDKNLIAREIDP